MTTKFPVGLWIRTLLLAGAVAMLGCVADDGQDVASSSAAIHYGHGNGHHNGCHGHKVLVVNLGASITAGYTFDPTLLGIDLDPVYAGNPWVPRFAATVALALHTKVASYNLSVPGATSTEILQEQLPDAVEEIGRYPKGSVITIEAGGNDLRAFQANYIDYCMSPEPADQYVCMVQLSTTLGVMEANLRAMLEALREVAPDAPIVIMTQYNPLYGNLPDGTACAGPALLQVADMAFEGDPASNGAPVLGMNPRIRAIAADYGAAVADINGFLHLTPDPTTASGFAFDDPIYYGADCTHPAGTHDAIPNLLAADSLGAGYEALYGVFAFALVGSLF